ncbi:DUF6114 domain-containing protein [Microbispora bryophytorum]|uniref:Uncharacterized protein n=1 Tax=Microbispora bryophytorum subsp. camponoti TaxID=1677852 RepID=A0ABR8KZJ7_9ACTN|nr:DUF6114 domain-containing protein [Microbispora camponoti]MBD3144155.1 hypothetical protein [Microbispora camponoti]
MKWRRSRPFWGGLLVLAAGLELLSIPFATQALPLVIQSGTVGATYLIALVLIILGLMIWLQPGQRAFLGVVAVLVSIASFVYANLGGFLIGMLLGLVGGALAVAWAPAETTEAGAAPIEPAAPPSRGEGGITFTERRVVSGDERLEATRPQRPAEPADEGPRILVARVRREAEPPSDPTSKPASDLASEPASGDLDDPGEDPDDGGARPGGGGRGDQGPGQGPGPAAKALAIAVLPVILAAGTGMAREDPGTGGQGGSLLPGVVPSSVPGGLSDALHGVLPSEVPTALPTSLPTGLPTALPTDLKDAVGSLTGRKSPSPPPGKDGEDGEDGRDAPGASSPPGAVTVATETAAVRAPSLTMTGMKFTGVVEMPTATGAVKMLRFTMDKAVLEQPRQTMGPTTLTGSTFTFEGNVVICTTKMTAKLLGVPQEFTADHPNLLVRALKLVPSLNVPLTMTDVVSEQPYVTADSLRANDLHLVVGA